MRHFVLGATGKVGRHVVSALVERGEPVRALVRDPDTAGLPPEVELVPGELPHAAAFADRVSGSDTIFLVWPFLTRDGAEELVQAISRHAGRAVYLSAERRAEDPRPLGRRSSTPSSTPLTSGRSCDRPGSPPTR
jgi:uncharacterized protein YbjT (DUF2867 family)